MVKVGKMSELQEKSEIAERERDFYRSKLRLIEIYCTKAITEPHPDRKVVQAEEILEVIASVDEVRMMIMFFLNCFPLTAKDS